MFIYTSQFKFLSILRSWDLISFFSFFLPVYRENSQGKCKECEVIFPTIINVVSVYQFTLLARFHTIGWNKQRLIVSVEDTIFLHSQVNCFSCSKPCHPLGFFFLFWATYNFLTINVMTFSFFRSIMKYLSSPTEWFVYIPLLFTVFLK
jgi:hypothetical protein